VSEGAVTTGGAAYDSNASIAARASIWRGSKPPRVKKSAMRAGVVGGNQSSSAKVNADVTFSQSDLANDGTRRRHNGYGMKSKRIMA
jgi:hypothetical protein